MIFVCYPKCSTCQKAKKWLEERGVAFEDRHIVEQNPTLEELEDVRTAVSEAVTNAILHGYEGKGGTVRLSAELYEGGRAVLEVVDCGVGIEDVEKAREPLYTSRPDMERSGMGFTVMETFMDAVSVRSRLGHGTTVRMEKQLGREIPREKEP